MDVVGWWILGSVLLIVVVCLGILALWLLYKKLKRNHVVKRRHEAEEVYDDSSESVYRNYNVNIYNARDLCAIDYSNCVFYERYCESREADSVFTFEGADKNTSQVRNGVSNDCQNGEQNSVIFTSQVEQLDNYSLDNKGVFVHKLIGQRGGRLEVSGVTLIVPQGALDSSTLLSVGVIWDKTNYPTLKNKQSLLSPIVLCQPSRVLFNTDVRLTFPHCAVNFRDDWNISVMRRSGDLTESSNWEITDADTIKQSIDTNQITLELRHFTLYTCIGESKENKVAAKAIHLVAFVSQLMSGALFKPRIYCINNYKQELQDVEHMMEKMSPGAKVSETSDLIIHDTEQDIAVELDKISPRWSLQGERAEYLPFESIWHSLAPHVTFVMEPTDTGVKEVFCEINCYQIQRENIWARIKIAEKMSMTTSPLSSSKDNPIQELFNEIIIMLDPEHQGESSDWRDFAEKLGCDMAKITWLGTQHSPTRLLMDKWLEENRSFRELSKLMLEINRPDVAGEINKKLPSIEQFDKSKTVSCSEYEYASYESIHL